MVDLDISEFISRMAEAFVPGKAAGIDATIQLKLTGAQAAEWFMTIKNGKCTFTKGIAPTARLMVTADSGDFIKIFTGKIDGMRAYMQGKIRIAGNMNLALKLLTLFKMQA